MPEAPSELLIREARVSQLDALVPLYDALQKEAINGGGRLSRDQVRDRLSAFLGDGPHHLHLIAFLKNEPVGIAHAFRLWPGVELIPPFYLKELYVLDGHRSCGVGEALLRAVARDVLARGSTCLQFSTGRANEGAVRFYDRLGLPTQDKVFYRIFDGGDLERLAGKAG